VARREEGRPEGAGFPTQKIPSLVIFATFWSKFTLVLASTLSHALVMGGMKSVTRPPCSSRSTSIHLRTDGKASEVRMIVRSIHSVYTRPE